MRFGKKEKLSPWYIGLFEVLEKVRSVAYWLALPPKLANVYNVLHVSMWRNYEPNPSHGIDFEPIYLKEDMSYEEQPIQILN